MPPTDSPKTRAAAVSQALPRIRCIEAMDIVKVKARDLEPEIKTLCEVLMMEIHGKFGTKVRSMSFRTKRYERLQILILDLLQIGS